MFVFGTGPDQDRHREMLSKAGLEIATGASEVLGDPAGHILFLTGADQPGEPDLAQIHRFIQEGGKLWLHRLTPDTSFLPTIRKWTSSALALRLPTMWLQQLEIAATQSPLLDGISDYHTCWATFAWTHGDRYSLRTTPIADFVIEPSGAIGDVLLAEPEWTGEWLSGPDAATLAQAIMYKIGKHTKNESPAAGLIRLSLGRGGILIDQVLWDEVADPNAIAIPSKAAHYMSTLGKNLAKPGIR